MSLFAFSVSHPKMAYFTNQNGGETLSISPGKVCPQSFHFASHFNTFGQGIHGLSNAKLDSPWEKLIYGKEKFTEIVTAKHTSKHQLTEKLFDLLSDKTWLVNVLLVVEFSI